MRQHEICHQKNFWSTKFRVPDPPPPHSLLIHLRPPPPPLSSNTFQTPPPLSSDTSQNPPPSLLIHATHTQAKYTGHTLPPQEHAHVLRLALATLQKLVKTRVLYPTANMTRCGAPIPLGGPALCGLNKRPYFACRYQMIAHINMLARFCESTWATCSNARAHARRPYVYRARKTAKEVEESLLRRAESFEAQILLAPKGPKQILAVSLKHWKGRGGGGVSPSPSYRVRPF